VRGRGDVPVRPRRRERARGARLMLLLCAALLLGSFVGLGTGTTQIGPGPTEEGNGVSVGEHALAYWTWTETASVTVPAALPVAVSTNPAAPTRLPGASRSYALNAVASGEAAVEWTFHEVAGAPRSTELELTFVVGTVGVAQTISVYLETPARYVLGTPTFTFSWGAGDATPTGLTVATEQVSVVACAAVGDCP